MKLLSSLIKFLKIPYLIILSFFLILSKYLSFFLYNSIISFLNSPIIFYNSGNLINIRIRVLKFPKIPNCTILKI